MCLPRLGTGYRRIVGRDDELDAAVESAHLAERRADLRTQDADARIVSADAHIADAEAQTAHADAHMDAAKAHMVAARAHMTDADLRAEGADSSRDQADLQLEAAARQLAKAQANSDEYERALYHYTQLVRHRMANPLQVICGTLQTLLDRPGMEESDRNEMLEAAHQQANVLSRICLEPEVLADVERGLEPRPFGHRRSGDT